MLRRLPALHLPLLTRAASFASLSAIKQARPPRSPFAALPLTAAQLRERTGAPIHEVKAALTASNGDAALALEELQRRGLLAASKKATRVAAEGLVGVAVSDGCAALVEVNAETDFVVRNPKFQELVRSAATAALSLDRGALGNASVVEDVLLDTLLSLRTSAGENVSSAVTAVAAEVRENVRLRRASWLCASGGVVGSYVHGGAAGMPVGRMGGIVVVEPEAGSRLGDEARAAVAELAKGLAMHVVASRPTFLSSSTIPAAVLEAQRAEFAAKAAQMKKPASVEAQVVAGQLGKWYGEVCLLNQSYLLNDAATVMDAIGEVSSRAGAKLSVRGFARLQAGEGVQKEQGAGSFAEEVASLAQV